MDHTQLDVTIVLPCFNEEKGLPIVVDDVKKSMQGLASTYEILVVDDKSSDNSVAVAKSLGCRLIRHPVNRGSGASRKTGILHARGKIVIMLDADGSYPASAIPEMLSFFPEYDQVNGARKSEEGTLRWIRQPTKWFIRMLASFLANYKIPDLNTGMKAFKRDLMIHYFWCVPDGFSCVSSMTLAFLCNGHAVKYIPIEYRKRIGKSKFHPFKDTFLYLLTIFRLITYFRPLKIFLPISFFIVLMGIIKSGIDYFLLIHRLQLSDIILIVTGTMIGLQGLIADLIVAQKRSIDALLTHQEE